MLVNVIGGGTSRMCAASRCILLSAKVDLQKHVVVGDIRS